MQKSSSGPRKVQVCFVPTEIILKIQYLRRPFFSLPNRDRHAFYRATKLFSAIRHLFSAFSFRCLPFYPDFIYLGRITAIIIQGRNDRVENRRRIEVETLELEVIWEFDRECPGGVRRPFVTPLVPIDNETSVLQLRSATFAPYTLSKCKYTSIRSRWIYVRMDSNNFGTGVSFAYREYEWSPFLPVAPTYLSEAKWSPFLPVAPIVGLR